MMLEKDFEGDLVLLVTNAAPAVPAHFGHLFQRRSSRIDFDARFQHGTLLLGCRLPAFHSLFAGRPRAR